jgi:hypothetical protein
MLKVWNDYCEQAIERSVGNATYSAARKEERWIAIREVFPPAPKPIMQLIKDALLECRQSPMRLHGVAHGREIGISTLQGKPLMTKASIEHLQKRSIRLRTSRDDDHLGVALGINLVTDVISTMFSVVSGAP